VRARKCAFVCISVYILLCACARVCVSVADIDIGTIYIGPGQRSVLGNVESYIYILVCVCVCVSTPT
jgi:hypothetical protein